MYNKQDRNKGAEVVNMLIALATFQLGCCSHDPIMKFFLYENVAFSYKPSIVKISNVTVGSTKPKCDAWCNN